MNFSINPRVASTLSPPIPTAQSWRTRYDGRRGPLLDLSQAVPGHAPCSLLLDRLAEAAATPEASRYGPILGDWALRAALAAETTAIYGGNIAGDNVAITAGCNQAFHLAVSALAGAGDAVILPSPWYFNHEMTLRMSGIDVRRLPCDPDAGFLPDPQAAAALLDPRVRAIVLVSPNNPTGAIYPASLIARFHALARDAGVALIVDETYRDLLPPGAGRPHDLFARGDWEGTLVHLYSFSKAYAIPGHRLGAIIAAPQFLSEVEKLADCLQICPPRAAQIAVAPSVTDTREWREGVRATLAARAEACRSALAKAKGWRLASIGAYFAFVSHPFGSDAASAVAERLAVEDGVLTLPGSFFGPGLDGFLRVAFANVDESALFELGDRLSSVGALGAQAG